VIRALKKFVAGVPVIGPAAKRLARSVSPGQALPFEKSSSYWDARYKAGGNSGAGSYSNLARFKADILNAFVSEHAIASVIEFGSGDGAQLGLAAYPRYIGVDVSPTAIADCRKLFRHDPSKTFHVAGELPPGSTAELSLSLDVIYHLVEDDVFSKYMHDLFAASGKYVIIYSSNEDKAWTSQHVRHRNFTRWIKANLPGWTQVSHIPNIYPYNENDPDHTSFADFYVYEKSTSN